MLPPHSSTVYSSILSTPVLFCMDVRMFSQVLWFPSTTQKHVSKWIGDVKFTVMDWHNMQGVFPPHTLCSRGRLWIHLNPEQDKAPVNK